MNVYLKGGPLNGETDTNLPADTVIYHRHALAPTARYRNTGSDDANGYRIFEYSPPKPGEPKPTVGVHDA